MLKLAVRPLLFRGAAVLLSAAGAVWASETGSFDRDLTVGGAVNLDVRSDIGGIAVRAGASASVRVHAVIKPIRGMADLGFSAANIRFLEQNPPIERIGNRIRIGYVADADRLRGVSMHLEIETPRTTQIRAATTSGGIRIDGVDGPIATNTSSGRTEVSNAGGNVAAQSGSGGIQLVSIGGTVEAATHSGRTEVSDVSGRVRCTTRSGHISIDNARGPVTANNYSGSIDAFQLSGPMHAETTSGSIQIAQINPAAVRASSNSGSIKIDLADRSGYAIDAQSRSGKVSGPALEGPQPIAENHLLRGLIGAGGPLVDLDTHSSKIEVN